MWISKKDYLSLIREIGELSGKNEALTEANKVFKSFIETASRNHRANVQDFHKIQKLRAS